jgi:predicted DNA-binding transcriptional regulator AlpA
MSLNSPKNPPQTPPEFVGAAYLAKHVLGCSTKSIERMARDGRIPPPVKLGGLRRWPLAGVREAITAAAHANPQASKLTDR